MAGLVLGFGGGTAVLADPNDAVDMLGTAESPVMILRVETAPVIDGRLDDEVWADAPVIDDLTQVEPLEGAEPTQSTEIRIVYDQKHIYIAFRCFDTEPDEIVATQMRRDVALGPDDRVGIVIDPYFDRRNGFFFEMNPAGSRGDALIEQNRIFRRDWDGIWFGKASIDDEGWVAEFAIPFQTISFNPDTTRWGFNASRGIRRTNEDLRWRGALRNLELRNIAETGVIGGIEDIDQGIGLDFKPYALGRFSSDQLNDDDDLTFDAGFDLRYRITPQLTTIFTFNTDFAETEVDERQVNLTRFPLFFPEKREFFLQDAGIFEFASIRRSPLPFHSRRIGLVDGEVVPIIAGAKLTGRAGPWNVGVLDVQTDDRGDIAGQNLFVGRASLNVLDESTVGIITTHGNPRGDRDNWLAGADFNYRNSSFNGDKTLTGSAWFQHTDTEGSGNDSSAFGARFGYPNDRVRWEVGFDQIGRDFFPALGFVTRRGIREYWGNWRYRWRPNSELIRRVDAGFFGFLVTDLDTNHLESRRLNFELLELETQDGDELAIEYTLRRELNEDVFEISDGVEIQPGRYDWGTYEIMFSSSDGRPVGGFVMHEGGDFWDGTRTVWGGGIDVRASRHVIFGAGYEYNDIDLAGGDFIVRIASAQLDIQFTPDLTWSTIVQYDNDSENLGINSRVRWIVQPGNELFFVINQGYRRIDDLSFRSELTEVTTKVGWTFRF